MYKYPRATRKEKEYMKHYFFISDSPKEETRNENIKLILFFEYNTCELRSLAKFMQINN